MKKAGVMFHNWEEHNGKCAKRRAQDANRQATRRVVKSQVTVMP